jgi:hypothetical protein
MGLADWGLKGVFPGSQEGARADESRICKAGW